MTGKRKFESGSSKRKRKEREDKLAQALQGSMNRIILTIPVTVATAERSFSKLKLIKNYLRSTMSQERLNGLAMLSIEKKMAAELDYSSVIFPERLKRLVVSNTTLDWKEAWIFEMIPNLEVLTLKCRAFVGNDWETNCGVFPRLKFLKLDDLDIVTWRASSTHFPMLQRLEVHQCPYLMEIPADFGNIYTLELIELSKCNDAATSSARDIQKEQESSGSDCLKILLDPGLRPIKTVEQRPSCSLTGSKKVCTCCCVKDKFAV